MATKIFLILSLIIKLISDAYVFWVFGQVFKYFLNKKRSSLKKEALNLSPLNFFIISSVFFMFFMRVLGTLFNTQNGIVSLIDSVYNTNSYIEYRIIMGDIVFPLRDFLEVLMFSYLFFYQSKKKRNLQKVNERYLKLMREENEENRIEKNVQG